MELTTQLNILGNRLTPCSTDPVTGFYRDGCCRTGEDDEGRHVVCAYMTEDFLDFSKTAGNDLSTPRPEWGFPGLQPGDSWCLCALRWREAYDAGMAPPVFIESTHQAALQYVPLEALLAHAVKVAN